MMVKGKMCRGKGNDGTAFHLLDQLNRTYNNVTYAVWDLLSFGPYKQSLIVQVLTSKIRDSYEKETLLGRRGRGSSGVCNIESTCCRQNPKDGSPGSCPGSLRQTWIQILLGRDFTDVTKVIIGGLSWIIWVNTTQSHDLFKVDKLFWLESERWGRRGAHWPIVVGFEDEGKGSKSVGRLANLRTTPSQ